MAVEGPSFVKINPTICFYCYNFSQKRARPQGLQGRVWSSSAPVLSALKQPLLEHLSLSQSHWLSLPPLSLSHTHTLQQYSIIASLQSDRVVDTHVWVMWPFQSINSKVQTSVLLLCRLCFLLHVEYVFTPVWDLDVFPLPSTHCLPSDYFQSTETWTPPVVSQMTQPVGNPEGSVLDRISHPPTITLLVLWRLCCSSTQLPEVEPTWMRWRRFFIPSQTQDARRARDEPFAGP